MSTGKLFYSFGIIIGNLNICPMRGFFTKAIAKELGEAKGNSRYLHKLFPEGPLKYACKLAGLPKPPTCL